jgi:hypothetical protein
VKTQVPIPAEQDLEDERVMRMQSVNPSFRKGFFINNPRISRQTLFY